MGVKRTRMKRNMLPCLEDFITVKENVSSLTVEVIIFDGAAIVNMLWSGTAKTFVNYANDILKSYITSQVQHVTKLDIIWDVYIPQNLKTDTCSMSKMGLRRHVEPSSAVPRNWQEFLHISDIKTWVVFLLGKELHKYGHWQTGHHHTPYWCILHKSLRCFGPSSMHA